MKILTVVQVIFAAVLTIAECSGDKCIKRLEKSKHLQLENVGEGVFMISCQDGYHFARAPQRHAITFRCGNGRKRYPKCVKIRKLNGYQNDDSSSNLVEPHWKPYGNDVVGHFNAGVEDSNATKDYEYASYDYDGDYESEESYGEGEAGSADYGQYYDYDYEDRNETEYSGDLFEDDGTDEDTAEQSTNHEIVKYSHNENSTDIGESVETNVQDYDEEKDFEGSGYSSEARQDTEYYDESKNDYDESEDDYDESKNDYDESEDDYDESEDDYDESNDDYDEYETEDDYDQEESSADYEEELLYRNYEILSDFYKKHFVDLRVLDTSCDPEETPPPEVDHGFVKEYRTAENVLMPGQHYHEVSH